MDIGGIVARNMLGQADSSLPLSSSAADYYQRKGENEGGDAMGREVQPAAALEPQEHSDSQTARRGRRGGAESLVAASVPSIRRGTTVQRSRYYVGLGSKAL